MQTVRKIAMWISACSSIENQEEFCVLSVVFEWGAEMMKKKFKEFLTFG